MLTLLRYESSSLGTFGVLLHGSRWLCHTLEPADCSGHKNCAVASGVYPLIMEYSPHFGVMLPTIVVKGRSGIRFHAGNSVIDTKGCVLPGRTRECYKVQASGVALQDLITYISTHNITKLKVVNYDEISN